MFVKAATALLALATLSQATITITNFDIVGNGTSTIQWASSDLDNDPPSFTIELTNPSFHTQFGVGNNVQTTDGKVVFQTPGLQPGPDYGIQFVAINNASDILAQVGPFPVAEHDVSSTTASTFATGTQTISAIQGTTSTPGALTPTSNAGSSVVTPINSPSNGGSNTPSTTSTSAAAAGSIFGSGGDNGGGSGSGANALNVPAAGMFLAGLIALLA